MSLEELMPKVLGVLMMHICLPTSVSGNKETWPYPTLRESGHGLRAKQRARKPLSGKDTTFEDVQFIALGGCYTGTT